MDFTQLMKNTPESTKLGHSTHAIACIVMKTSKLKDLEQQQHERPLDSEIPRKLGETVKTFTKPIITRTFILTFPQMVWFIPFQYLTDGNRIV